MIMQIFRHRNVWRNFASSANGSLRCDEKEPISAQDIQEFLTALSAADVSFVTSERLAAKVRGIPRKDIDINQACKARRVDHQRKAPYRSRMSQLARRERTE